MKYYFAYGSNLNQQQMKERCPKSVYIGNAIVENYCLVFTSYSIKRQCGCADIVPEDGSIVQGAIYSMTDDDFTSMDRSEGPNYRQTTIKVLIPNIQIENVVTYTVLNKRFDIKPSKDYLGIIIAGAEALKLSPEYIADLGKHSTQD